MIIIGVLTVVHVVRNIVVLGFVEAHAILLEGGIVENRLEEIAADGKCRTTALAESTCSEVYAAIFATYPCTHYELRADGHEPRIRVVVRCTCLTSKLRVAELPYVSPKTHRRSSTFRQSALQQFLHEISALVGNSLVHGNGTHINLLAVFVENSLDESWLMMLTVVGNGAIGIGEFEQVHITRA